MKKMYAIGILALLVMGLVVAGVFASEDTEVEECGCKCGDFESMKGKRAEKRAEMGDLDFEEMKEKMVERKALMEERRAEMQEVMELGYDAWYEYVGNLAWKPKMTELITEENFDTFAAMYEAMQNGGRELTKELAEELGFEKPERRKGFGHRMRFR